MSMEIDRYTRLQRVRIERRFDELGIPRPTFTDEAMIEEVKQHIIIVLFGINGFILLVMGGISYFLAGKTLSPIQKMMEEQDQFVSDASHELKTPLTAMKSALEVYSRDPKLTLNEAKQVLKDNINEVDRLQILSESLLTLLEHETGALKRFFISVNLPRLMEKTLHLVQHSAQKKQIKITIENLPQQTIWGSEERLLELFTILLDNAIKYSNADSKISITGIMIKRGVEVSITDTGVGIAEKDIPHIFNRFYRADTSRSKAKGYGLGLSIAKKIVDFHQGSISIESIIGKGTTVRVWFPRNSAHIKN